MNLLALLRVAAVVLGLLLVFVAVASSIRTVILPRAVASRITRVVFQSLRVLFEIRVGRGASYERRDSIFALFGPLSLMLLLLVWVLMIMAGYTAIFWGLGSPLYAAFQTSGSSILTLGFAAPHDGVSTAFVLSEAFLGLIELALLITYLPTLYGAFQRRERLVTMLEVRAGSPPTGVDMLARFFRLHTLDHLSNEVWEAWEAWFVDVEETHTSLPALSFFRSPQAHRSWITAAGAVLDAAAIYASSLAIEHDPHADLCIRAGYLCLRQVALFFRLPFNPAPRGDEPISIAREEFDEAFERLRQAGLPMKPDRDQAWRSFRGWRVNYDDVLVEIAALVSAPYAPWSSDRGKRIRPRVMRALAGL